MKTTPDVNGTWFCKWRGKHGEHGSVQLWAPNRLVIRVHDLDGRRKPYQPNAAFMGWPIERPARAPALDFSEELCYETTRAIFKAMETSRLQHRYRRDK